MGFRHTKAYYVSELAFIMMYIYGRILLGTPAVIKISMCSQNNFLIKLASVALIFQSYYYMYLMFIILKSRANGYLNKKRFSVVMHWFTALIRKQIELLGLNKQNKINTCKEELIT